MTEKYLISEKIDGLMYWFSKDLKLAVTKSSTVYLLPAYDEFIISYKNRGATLAAVHQKKVLSSNVIFYPAIIVNGQVAGLWKRSVQKDTVNIETGFLCRKPKQHKVL